MGFESQEDAERFAEQAELAADRRKEEGPKGFSDWWHFTGRHIPGDRLAIALEAWSAGVRCAEESRVRWVKLADERAIEVADLKRELAKARGE
jgi:hypothetical protein